MSSTFNGHCAPEIVPDTAYLSWVDHRPECRFTLNNQSSWPIVYKVKVQESILNLSTVYPAQGVVGAKSTVLISLHFELRKMREHGLASLKKGHRIQVESWYISEGDALLDSGKLLLAIKKKVDNPRKPDISKFRICYSYPAGSAGSSRQDTLPSFQQTPRQPPTPRSMTTPHVYRQPSPPPTATPAINIVPPSRQQTLAPLSSDADSPTLQVSTSQPTSTHEQIARYIAQSAAPILRRTRSSSSRMADSTTTRSTGTQSSIPIPTQGGGDNSPTSSVAASFISVRGDGNPQAGGPSDDAMEIDPVLVEEPAPLNSGAEPLTSATQFALPFAEFTGPVGSSWTRPGPSSAPSPLHLSPTRGVSSDTSETGWMTYIQVDRSLRGKVKIPQGQPISCGGFSDVHKCEVRFEKSAETNPKMVAVKVLRRVGLNALNESDVLPKMIERASREVYAWSAIEHPNVVPLVGATFTPMLALISPWYEKGDLRNYLASTPGANRLKLLLDIARGLAYLHSLNPPVVHGDVKPENVLINDNGDALIMDFGLATVMEANPWYNSSHRRGGSTRWMAPELLLNEKETRSCSSDAYSYGGVAFEVMTSELPHSKRSEVEITLAMYDAKKEPCEDWAKYPQLPEKIKEMIIKCWSRRYDKRPTMRAIEEGLGRLADESLQNRA